MRRSSSGTRARGAAGEAGTDEKGRRMRRSDELEPDDRDRRIDGAQPPEPTRAGIRLRYVVIVLFAIVLIAFAIANFRPVRVSFLLFETRARLVTVIVVAAALGFVIGYFTGRPTRLQRRWLRKREEDQTG
jgi:uncharacterized integral membrane protein